MKSLRFLNSPLYHTVCVRNWDPSPFESLLFNPGQASRCANDSLWWIFYDLSIAMVEYRPLNKADMAIIKSAMPVCRLHLQFVWPMDWWHSLTEGQNGEDNWIFTWVSSQSSSSSHLWSVVLQLSMAFWEGLWEGLEHIWWSKLVMGAPSMQLLGSHHPCRVNTFHLLILQSELCFVIRT